MTVMEPALILITFPVLVLLMGGVWLSGYRSRFKRIPGLRRSPERDYFIGLNYLLNDEPDDAIDLFISALEVSAATLETHLALGTLLRRRGKVDRAIAHCQKLLDSSQFGEEQRAKIGLNLVRSYIAAGLLDRAEHLLAVLKETDGGTREAALELAITVFQKEKEWQPALGAAVELLEICPVSRRAGLQMQSSHFHCELAEIALGLDNFPQAREMLGNAAALCRANVRIYFLLARVEAAQGALQESVRHLQKVPQYDPDFAGEACAPLLRALQAAGMEKQLAEMLDSASEGGADTRLLPAIIPFIKEKKGEQAALKLLQAQLRRSPSLGLLAEALDIAARNSQDSDVAGQGAAILHQYLQQCAHYRCEHCGFELRNLHWLCPGCSTWGVIKPLVGKLPLL